MSDLVKAILLGAVQGVTEFLPISSSGHLIAAETILGFRPALAFDVALHVATLLAVLLYFGRDILRLLGAPERWAVAWRIVIGTLPAGLIGFAFRDWRANISPWLVVGGWAVSATYLLLTRNRQGKEGYAALHPAKAFLVGGSQGIAAILPGFSRSGASIASGLWLGLDRAEAFRFSFLLAIPLMLGAGLLEGRHLLGSGAADLPGGWPALALAALAAFAVGLAAIHLLFRAVAGNRFHRFGWYNLLAGLGFTIYLSCH